MAAIGNDVITRLTGYNILPGDFSTSSGNLPIQDGVFGEINTANQGSIEINDDGIPLPVKVTNIQQVANVAGWGSPLYQACKLILPNANGLPVYLYPQRVAVGATAKVLTIEVSGTATGNGEHFLVVCGRKSVGGQAYKIPIVNGDNAATIHDKVRDALNNVLGSPVSATSTDYLSEATSKWKGATADEINISVDTNGSALGLTYTVTSIQSGAGTPDVTDSLELIGNRWITNICSCYLLSQSTITDQFQDFNGTPVIGDNPATGRYSPQVFKPFFVHTGSIAENPSSITDALLNQVTIEVCPAPLSKGLSMEQAAIWTLLHSKCMRDTPELDIIGAKCTEMPTPTTSIGVMADWQERDAIVKAGCSTVMEVGGLYEIQDPVTTYHPIGEVPPQFRYVRNLGVDWNVYYTYRGVEESELLGKMIAKNGETVSGAIKSISPNRWKSIVAQRVIKDLVLRGLIVDEQFSIESLAVQVSTVNPDRFQTTFRYKRSGIVRQSDTEATAGFDFGEITIN